MKKVLLTVATGLALAIPMFTLSMDADAAGRDGQQRTVRGQLVHQIVAKWGNHVQEAYDANVKTWAMSLVPMMAKAPIATLERAAQAKTFERMNDTLLGTRVASNDVAQKLGDADKDLVFVPITPCRILDTRVAGGQIGAGTVRGIDVTAVSSYAFQGGASNDCGGAGIAGSFAAVAINFTIVSPQGTTPGNMTAYPVGTTMPTSSSLNFKPGDIVGNLGIFKLDQGAAANELNVYSTHTTHLVGDMVGYFTNPTIDPIQLDCTTTPVVEVDVAAGVGNNAYANACPAGYAVTGTNCETNSFVSPLVFASNGACSARNNGTTTAKLRASRNCCRVPAR